MTNISREAVERYRPEFNSVLLGMRRDKNGKYVKYEDYAALLARTEDLEAVLKWYAETVGDCNRHGETGNIARDRLAKDVGNKAEEVLKEQS